MGKEGVLMGDLVEGLEVAAENPAVAATPAPDVEPVKPSRQAPWLRKYAFKKGAPSPNPKGRPRLGEGGKQDYRKLFREQMNQRGADVVKACLDKAAAGDTKMIAIAMRYLMPEAKADSGNIDLELDPNATMEERLAALVNKISTGDVSVEAGAIAAKSLRDITESAKTLEALQRMDAIQAELKSLDRKGKGY